MEGLYYLYSKNKGKTLGCPTKSDRNWAVQPQKMARGLKFQNKEVEGLYYL